MSEIGYTPDVSPNRPQRRFRLTEYDPATVGGDRSLTDRRRALRWSRGLPSRTRSSRLRRGLGQPVGAATNVQHAFACYERISRRRLPAYGRRDRRCSPADLGLVEHDADKRGHREVLDEYEASNPVRGGPSSRSSRTSTSSSAASRARTTPSPRPSSGPRHRRQEGRAVVGDPSTAAAKVRERPTDQVAVPRERRPTDQVADRPAGSRLRGDARVARRPRVRGRVARGQRRRLRLPTEASTRLHRRSARPP